MGFDKLCMGGGEVVEEVIGLRGVPVGDGRLEVWGVAGFVNIDRVKGRSGSPASRDRVWSGVSERFWVDRGGQSSADKG